jgi:hypothetical protein
MGIPTHAGTLQYLRYFRKQLKESDSLLQTTHPASGLLEVGLRTREEASARKS